MNEVEKVLYRTRKTLTQACKEAGVEFDSDIIKEIQECSHCGIWYKLNQLIPDLDKNPICNNCNHFYGL